MYSSDCTVLWVELWGYLVFYKSWGDAGLLKETSELPPLSK